MGIMLSSPKDINSLAQFLEEMNQNKETHIGYCGQSKEEIYHTLLQDFSDLDITKSFAVAYDKEEIIGAVGFDIDKENKSAEVWGPFIKDLKKNPVLARALWEKANALSDIEINVFSFFINKENTFAQKFVINNGAVNKGSHLILGAFRDELGEVNLEQIEPYSLQFEDAFSSLHEMSFPNTYFSASEIYDRLNEYNQLLVMTDKEEKIKGYVYVEASPEHSEGAIEYIAVSPNYRKQGVGTKLIRAALAHLFSYETINEITLSVSKNNENAIKLYQAAGFKEVHELVHYQKVLKKGDY